MLEVVEWVDAQEGEDRVQVLCRHLRQYLYFCTSKASKSSTSSLFWMGVPVTAHRAMLLSATTALLCTECIYICMHIHI